MGWTSGYLQGSFRGAPFFIDRAETEGGRRMATHQFPERDDVYHEDLGRKARTFSFSAYVVGDDYFQKRENLVQALEAAGPGRLVHPYRGIFQVVVLDFRLSEQTSDGRMASFDITMEEQEVVQLTNTTPNTTRRILQARDALVQSLGDDFKAKYSLSDQVVSAVQDVLDTVDGLSEKLLAAKQVVATVSDFQREVSNLQGKAIQLVQDAGSILDPLQSITLFGTDPRDRRNPATFANAAQQQREMARIITSTDTPETNTPREIALDPNYPARQLQLLVQRMAVAGAVGIMSTLELATVEEAETARNALFQQLDLLLLSPDIDDASYSAAEDAKDAVQQDLNRRILELARLVVYTFPETRPSLVVAFEVYGDLTREQELVDRNGIEHPGFISPAGVVRVQING